MRELNEFKIGNLLSYSKLLLKTITLNVVPLQMGKVMRKAERFRHEIRVLHKGLKPKQRLVDDSVLDKNNWVE